jgi:DNA polymerase III epsilon subunit-like protein
MTANKREIFVSVDVETAGPIPGEFSLLSVGACLVSDPGITFSCMLKPINERADPDAMKVAGFTLDDLRLRGVEPKEAMIRFSEWLDSAVCRDGKVVFVGFNAPFDWSFINYYFHRFVGRNPFGFTALDIKALYMGATGCMWTDTRSSEIAEHLKPTLSGDHDALHDALYQAELFRLVRRISGLDMPRTSF